MILALDLGLSAVKVALADAEGTTVQVERQPYPTRFDGDRAEQEPADWWHALVQASSRIEGKERVELIVPTGHMHGLVLVDSDLDPLLPCLTLHDRRGAELLQRLDAAAFHAATGEVLEPPLPIAKLLWIEQSHPELLGKAEAILSPKDYLRARLVGRLATEPIDAAGTGLYDPRSGSWSSDVIASIGLPTHLLPDVMQPPQRAGALRPEQARELGLRPGTEILVGAGDDIELLGATAHAPDAAVEHVGTTGAVIRTIEEPSLDPHGRLELYPTCSPGYFATGTSVANVGAVFAWVDRKLGLRASDVLADDPGPRHPVGLAGLLAERFPDSRPARRGAIAGIGIDHGVDALARAMLLGVAFGMRDVLAAVERSSGALTAIYTSGGSTDRAWLRLRASVYDRPLLLVDGDATARGCIALGLVASGVAPDPESAAAALPRGVTQFDPAPELAESLAALRDRYLALRQNAGHAHGGLPAGVRGGA